MQTNFGLVATRSSQREAESLSALDVERAPLIRPRVLVALSKAF